MTTIIAWISMGIAAFAVFAAILALMWVSKVQDEYDKLADHVTRPSGETPQWARDVLDASPPTEPRSIPCHPGCPACAQGRTGAHAVYTDGESPLPGTTGSKLSPRRMLTRDNDGNPIYLTDAFGNSVRDYLPKQDEKAYDPHKPLPQVRPERNDS